MSGSSHINLLTIILVLGGLVLGPWWAGTGPLVGWYWALGGLVLGPWWAGTGPLVGWYWALGGLVLGPWWAGTGPVVGWYWARGGLVLGPWWAGTGWPGSPGCYRARVPLTFYPILIHG